MMTRPTQAALAVGTVGALAWIVLAALGAQVMPSYLAGWLFCLALPLGALPVLMLFELLGLTGWPIETPLRRFLLLQPVATLFAIPVLLRLSVLYERPGMHHPPPPGWMAPGFLAGRMIVLLLIWTGLALIFARPPRQRPRRVLAGLGLFLHFPMATLAAVDWVMSLDPGLASSAFGLLLISAQVSTALCAAALALAVGSSDWPAPVEATPLLLTALGSWVFLHFIQFLVVWSADQPTDIVWYQHRIGGPGETVLWFAFAAALLAMVLLLPDRLSRTPAMLANVASMLLLVHLIEMFWLVTPGLRGHFTLTWPDLAALLGFVGLAAGVPLLIHRPATTQMKVRHERA